MKKSKLFAMMLIPAAFAACTNDEIVDCVPVDGAANGNVEDVLFSVSMSADQTRGQYAGYENVDDEENWKIFTNFYLEPKFAGDNLVLSDNENFAGDMFGFCLSDGTKALTNLPFYVAGYGSQKGTKEGDKTYIYPFAAHTVSGDYYTSDNKLYKLAFATSSYDVQGKMTKSQYDKSVEAINQVTSGTNLAANALDVRKAIVRNNAGVMSGNYIAYYPYNAEFCEPGSIPVGKLNEGKSLRVGVALSANQKEAIASSDFYNDLFAVSASPITVNGKTKTGDIKLTPRTGAIFFKIFDATQAGGTNENEDVKIKRIVVQAQENAAETDFILEGSVPMDNLMTINGKTTTSMVGVQFTATKFSGTAEADAKWTMTYCYPNLEGKSVQLKVYDDKGRVAIVKKTAIPAMGASVTYTVKVNELKFAATEREIFTPKDFEDEAKTEGTLILMDDIIVDALDINQKLTIKGGKTLTLTGAINKDLTMDGAQLVLNNATINANVSSNNKVTLKGYNDVTIAKKISAATLVNDAKVTLQNVAVTTLENNKVLNVKYLADDASVVVGTLNNHDALNVVVSGVDNKTSVLNVTTLKNTVTKSATPTVTVAATSGKQHAKLVATTINNEATKKYPNNDSGINYTPQITINGKTNASDVTNKGMLTWATTEDMNYNVTNNGTFAITGKCNSTGSVTNSGTLNINNTVNITAGGITTTSTTNVDKTNGNLIASGANFTVNGGKVNCYGTVNGSSKIVVNAGEFIKYVYDAANLQAALATTGVAARYNAICVAADLADVDFAFSTQKKFYIDADLTTLEAVAFNEVVTRNSVVYTADGNATMNQLTINGGSNLTLNGGVINIANTFFNYGTFNAGSSAVVNCNKIDGNGNWGKYPNF